MLTDGSENFEHTWEFLDRRIEDMIALSKYKTEEWNSPPYLETGRNNYYLYRLKTFATWPAG